MTGVRLSMRVVLSLTLGVLSIPSLASAAITAVPPADLRSAPSVKSSEVQMKLSSSAPAARVVLPEPTSAERDALKARNAQTSRIGVKKSTTKRSLAIAFPRDVPADSKVVQLASLAWQTLADGTRAARLQVTSPTAAALRVAMQLSNAPANMTLAFGGSGVNAQTFAVSANDVASDSTRYGMFWSPVLDGDVATIEIRMPSSSIPADATLTLTKISHQVVAPSALRSMGGKAVEDIGLAGSCEIDVACVTPQTAALTNAAKAVAQMEFTQDDGFTHLCTGTLLNDSISSNTPYLFSAAHCLNSATAARTLNTYWFFDAIACGDRTVPPYVQQASGAMLLARSPDWDWALARLNATPPAGAQFSAWRAEPIPAQTPIVVLHHPEADLKKWTSGATQGYQLYTDGSSYALVGYNQGSTEPGSSGAGLLTFLQAGGYYEVRGGLWSGEASCQNKAGIDQYSRLDNMLPVTRQFLTPDVAGTPGQAVVVEFYNRALDHYFMTIDPREISDLDTGVHGGWERTGLRFLAYAQPTAGANPVCRFYRTPGFGDSHFYSASPPECQVVIDNPQTYPGWTYESGSVFYIALPDPVSGACAGGTQPVWRFYNQRTVNHRYTSDQETRDEMRADPITWQGEGYGPDNVIMCAPVGS